MNLSAREAYRQELTHLAESDEKIICIEADLAGKSHPFQERFPDRFFNMGIAEAAAIDIATGLAKAGFKPFFSTFSPFAVLRAAESIKLSLGYMRQNIKIVAPYAGCSGAWFGTTHHCLEDIAIIQSFPGIRIAAPYGELETRAVVRDALKSSQPFYIRMGRNKQYMSLINNETNNKMVYQRNLNDNGICLVSVGEEGSRLCEEVMHELPFVSHAHLVYLDYESLQQQVNELAKFSKVVIVEEHRVTGGVSSVLSILLNRSIVIPFTVNQQWPSIGGNHDEILEYLGFTSKNLISLIKKIVLTK